jgi:hypothetical protein
MSNAISLYNKRPDPFLPVFAAPDNGKLMITTKERFEKDGKNCSRLPLFHITDERLASWFPKDGDKLAQTLPRLLGLYRALKGGKELSDTRLTHEEMMPVVRPALKDGRLVVYEEELEQLGHFLSQSGITEKKGPYTYKEYEKVAVAYAAAQGINTGTPQDPATLSQTEKTKDELLKEIPAGKGMEAEHFYSATEEEKGWKDVLDDKCPSANYRSESMESASEDVKEWLSLEENCKEKYRKSTLGIKKGGGFLKGSTRVVTISKGTLLYRYCTVGYEKGSWQLILPLEGDPRAFAALPEDSPATYVVVSEAPENTEALIGIGAPRCSNKPGGPIQICLACNFAKTLKFTTIPKRTT